MKLVSQLFENDCGVACLKMLLVECNKDINYSYLPFKEKKGNYSYQEIKNLASNYGMNLVGFRLSDKSEIVHNDTFPLIVGLELDDGIKHAIVVEKIKKNRIKILDPAKGKRWMKLKDFYKVFDGTGLLIDKFTYYKCPFHFKESSSFRIAVPLILQIASALSLMLGVKFIDEGTYIFYPIICFSLAAIFEVIIKGVLFKEMRRMDMNTLPDVYVDRINRFEFLKRFEEYKQSEVVYPIQFFTSFMMASIFCFILLINNVNNLSLIMLVMGIVLFDSFVVNPLLEKRKNSLELIQRKALLESNNNRFILQCGELTKKSYIFGKLVLLRKYAYTLIILFAVILLMIFSHIVSVPYVICYFAMSYSLLQNLFPIFTYEQINQKHEINKSKFYNILHQNDEMVA